MLSSEGRNRQFQYRLHLHHEWPEKRGRIEAVDEEDAMRQLRIIFMTPHLPEDLELIDQTIIDPRSKSEKSRKLRRLLGDLRKHHEWLTGAGGTRADFSARDLSGLRLPRLNLAMADLSGCDLSDCDLSGSDLQGANLTGANLGGANLSNVDFSGADLSDANFNRANLTGAQLDRADVWRANFQGSTISLWDLHGALRCLHPGSNLPAEAAV